MEEKLRRKATKAQKAGDRMARFTFAAVIWTGLIIHDGFSLSLFFSIVASIVGIVGCFYFYKKENNYNDAIRNIRERAEFKLYNKPLTIKKL